MKKTFLIFSLILILPLIGMGCSNPQQNVVEEQQKQIEELTKKVEALTTSTFEIVTTTPITTNTSPKLEQVAKPIIKSTVKKVETKIEPKVEPTKQDIAVDIIPPEPIIPKLDPQILIEKCKAEMETQKQKSTSQIQQTLNNTLSEKANTAIDFCGANFFAPDAISGCINTYREFEVDRLRKIKEELLSDLEILLQQNYIKCISQ